VFSRQAETVGIQLDPCEDAIHRSLGSIQAGILAFTRLERFHIAGEDIIDKSQHVITAQVKGNPAVLICGLVIDVEEVWVGMFSHFHICTCFFCQGANTQFDIFQHIKVNLGAGCRSLAGFNGIRLGCLKNIRHGISHLDHFCFLQSPLSHPGCPIADSRSKQGGFIPRNGVPIEDNSSHVEDAGSHVSG